MNQAHSVSYLPLRERPYRHQLQRWKGWRMPPATVKVDRTTPWGNPFRIGAPGVPDAETAVAMFRALVALPDVLLLQSEQLAPFASARLVQELGGRCLACWCKPEEACHANVLLQAANPPVKRQDAAVLELAGRLEELHAMTSDADDQACAALLRELVTARQAILAALEVEGIPGYVRLLLCSALGRREACQ